MLNFDVSSDIGEHKWRISGKRYIVSFLDHYDTELIIDLETFLWDSHQGVPVWISDMTLSETTTSGGKMKGINHGVYDYNDPVRRREETSVYKTNIDIPSKFEKYHTCILLIDVCVKVLIGTADMVVLCQLEDTMITFFESWKIL